MSVDLSEFEPERKGPPCSAGLALKELSGERLIKAVAAMAATHTQNSMISKRLMEWTTVKVTPIAVGKHRKEKCNCQ